jgi:BlaI family transcriptional regulator, penicillinase repressor
MNKPLLTPVELEIMQIVWDQGEASVRDVHRILGEQKQVAYTTVMTMMKILEEKGHLHKKKQGRSHIYSPIQSRQQALSSMLGDFLNRVYKGSARDLVVNLVKDKKLSNEELSEIADIIGEK